MMEGGLSHAAMEALRQAAAEGLILDRSARSATGYKGVKQYGRRFDAALLGPGVDASYLGVFGTAEEAALAIARKKAAGPALGAA